MMGRIYIYILTALLLLSGCSDDSFRGTSDGMYGNGAQSIPVVVALGDPSGGIVKGAGAVDGMDEWAGRSIYVYAFGKGKDVSYVPDSRRKPLDCLVDGSRDDASSNAGKRAVVRTDVAYAVWDVQDSELVYPADDELGYDFFAYYADDAMSGNRVDRDENSVRVNVEIDGNNDLMSSKAELTEAQLESFTEKDRIFVREKAFGYYTARRNVVPTFHFRHHLVRLEFELVAGVMREEKKTVYIHSMAVRSKYRASFTVAHKDASMMGLDFMDESKELFLTEDSHEPMKECVVVTRPSPDIVSDNIKMGECLLVAPDVEYEAYMLMTEKREDGSVVVEKVRTPLTISYNGRPFEAGNQYRVKLTIYGATKVSASVEMEPWLHGGSIEMEEEKDKPII